MLALANPMKVRKIVEQVPQTDEEREASEVEFQERAQRPQRNNNRRDGGRGRPGGGGPAGQRGQSRPVAAAGDQKGSGGGGFLGSDIAKDPFARKRAAPKKGAPAAQQYKKRRPNLSLGTGGKTSRRATVNRRRGTLKKKDRSSEKAARAEAAAERKTISLPDGPISVQDLAELLDEKPVSIIKFLMTDLGVMASMTQSLDPATSIAVAEGFGKIVAGEDDYDEEDEEGDATDQIDEDSALALGVVIDDDDPADLLPRPPVVTIMGHVDHGKTSLLDTIRNTDVTAGEAGGITQAIASYQVNHNGNKITFIDTPGHAAFTDMRERGANITDIVILVVAADDGVMQQTADSIACARQSGVPLVVAVNKCDLETADPVKVMTDLTGYDVLTEEFGGDVLSAQISAKEGTNIDDLLDQVMLQAEVLDLKANPDRDAEGVIVEASVQKGLGTVASMLIQKGTLRVGDVFVAGKTFGKVRALISTADGKTRMKEAGPSTPVQVVGFESVPAAGDFLVVAQDEQTARELAESRTRIAREKSSNSYQSGLMSSVKLGFGAMKETREMCVVVKADVQGSAEALTRALRELKLENDEAVVTIKVLISEAGEVSKSDIAIASVTPDTTVLAFSVAASFAAMEDARAAGVPIEYYNIIYDAIESVESRMQEVLSPTPEGEYTGRAIVQEVFNIGGTGNIAGSRCSDGVLKKGGNIRVMRGDKILTRLSKIRTLRNFKAEADTIEAGNECGIGLLDFEDFQPDDIIECYVDV